MIEEVGVVAGYLAVVPYPPVVLTEPDKTLGGPWMGRRVDSMEPTSGLEPLTRSSSRLRCRVVAEQSLVGDPPVRTPYH